MPIIFTDSLGNENGIEKIIYNDGTDEHVLYESESAGSKTLESAPPITFTANGQPLIDWTIWGNTDGVGASKTVNVLSPQSDTSVWIYENESISSSGSMQKDNGYTTTDYISATSGDFSFVNGSSHSSWYRVAWYDSNKSFISQVSSYTDHATITAPSNAVYMRISCNMESQVALLIPDTGYMIPVTIDCNSLPPQSDTDVWIYVDQHVSTSGRIIPEVGYNGTDYLPAVSGALSFTRTDTSYSSWYRVAWYDSNKTFISQDSSYTDHATITAPSNAVYMMIGLNKNAVDIMLLSSSTTINIDIGSALLGKDETVSFETSGTVMPTFNGVNTISIGTTIQPEKIKIKYKE